MEESLLNKYYHDQPELLALLLKHSKMVAERAVQIVRSHPELNADEKFVREAAMLHDIGVGLCDAPGIHCHGTEPYIRHGILGAEILNKEGLPRHARVAERHTGTGLTMDEISAQQLPLPLRDYSPETIEEIIICYADKFYSKSRPDVVKTSEQVLRSLQKFGESSVARFRQWDAEFGSVHSKITHHACASTD